MEKSEILKRLNDEQRQVVTTTSGPILVLAGAGSGKTRVLTHRIAYLVTEGISTDRILAVTFTNKAARQMKERISRLLSVDCDLPWITTFHSACLRILRRQARHIGYDTHFAIYDESDQVSVMKGRAARPRRHRQGDKPPDGPLFHRAGQEPADLRPSALSSEASDPFFPRSPEYTAVPG